MFVERIRVLHYQTVIRIIRHFIYKRIETLKNSALHSIPNNTTESNLYCCRCSVTSSVHMEKFFFSKMESFSRSSGSAKQSAHVFPKTFVYCCVMTIGISNAFATEVIYRLVLMTVSPRQIRGRKRS